MDALRSCSVVIPTVHVLLERAISGIWWVNTEIFGTIETTGKLTGNRHPRLE